MPSYSYGDAEEHSSLTAAARAERGIENLSSIDQKLVIFAGAYTPAQIAEKTGLTPEEVAKRTVEIFNSVDYFTIEQMRAKAMISLNMLIAEAMNRLPTTSDRNAGAFFNATGGNLQRALKELGELEAQAAKNSSKMEAAHAKRMVYIVEMAFNRLLGKLSAKYPEEDPKEIAEQFQRSIMDVAQEIDNEIGVQV